MKIRVKDIEANPFRDLERNPVRQDKVDALKSSITDTGFWDNVVVRPHPSKPGKYQVAYGHHRLFAVRDLGIKEIDCPVKPVDDFNMIRMMAEENLSLWSATPGAANEAVWAAKNKLDDVLDQFETLDEFLGSHVENFPRGQQIFEFSRPEEYSKIRDYGVGLRPLMRFLGDNWEGTIKAALSALAEDAARAHAARLARRAERAKAKEEAARLEAERKAKEEEERKAAEEAARIELEKAMILAEEAAERERLAKEAEELRKEEEAAEKAKREAEQKALREAEKAQRKRAAEAKAEEDRIAAEEQRKALEAKRKEDEARYKADEERRKAEKAARDAEKAKLQAEAKAAADAKREADRIAKAAKEAREKAEREAKAAEKARKEAQAEAEKREAQRKAKEKLLADLESEGVDRGAYELFENQSQAGTFRTEIKNFNVPKAEHRALAESIVTKLGKDATSNRVVQEIRNYAVLKGYWQERNRIKTIRDMLKAETFDSKCRDVGGALAKATKDLRFIIMQVDKAMGNASELDTYNFHDLFSDPLALNYFKDQVTKFLAVVSKINLDPVKEETNITPEPSAPTYELQ